MTLEAGQMLQNRYRIVSMLGQGGMGAVYKAWDTRLNVSLAIKEMVPQPSLDQQTLEQLRQQFQQEAQILARLSHPHLVRVTDFFEEDGKAYLVMDASASMGYATRPFREIDLFLHRLFQSLATFAAASREQQVVARLFGHRLSHGHNGHHSPVSPIQRYFQNAPLRQLHPRLGSGSHPVDFVVASQFLVAPRAGARRLFVADASYSPGHSPTPLF